jgi:signal transduction histidine kinase
LNLFINALEAMGKDGRLSVRTGWLPAQKQILVTIQDSGPGIAPEVLPQIFDAFVTNKLSGSGLGLTITHDIIQQHSGRIEAENAAEGGARFIVYLPAKSEGT